MHALVAKIQPDKVMRWCADGEFLAIFCEPHAAHFRPAFQICTKATSCGSMADIQSATTEMRRGKKERR